MDVAAAASPSIMDVAAAASEGILASAGDTMLGGGRAPASHGRRRRRSQEDGDDASHKKHHKHRNHNNRRRDEDREDEDRDLVSYLGVVASPPPIVITTGPIPPTVRLSTTSGTSTPLGDERIEGSPVPITSSGGGIANGETGAAHVDSQLVAVAGGGGDPPRGNDAGYRVSEQEMTWSM